MRRNPIRNAFLAIAVLVLVGTGLLLRGYTVQFTRADTAEGRQAQAEAATAQIAAPAATSADAILAACRNNPDTMRKAGISCAAAAETKAAIADADTPPPGERGAEGADGATGPRGPGPTATQVALAIRTYCAANNDCRGTAGTNGKDGTSTTGATGSAGSKGDTGPAGPQGPAGSDGSDGRGIQSASCGDDGRWTVTYSDGTSEDAGECRASILP